MSDASLPYDPVFRAAFKYFLDERRWTATEFCERTRLAAGSPRRVNPSSVSDWLHRRKHPSNQAVIVVCETFGVPRSYFFQVGEELERERRKRRQTPQPMSPTDLEAVNAMVARGRETMADMADILKSLRLLLDLRPREGEEE